jgi:hypothetical protein
MKGDTLEHHDRVLILPTLTAPKIMKVPAQKCQVAVVGGRGVLPASARWRCPLVTAAGRCGVVGGPVVRDLRSACVVRVSAGWGGSAKPDSGAVAGGAARQWCSGIALVWEGRHARRRRPGRPAEVAAGPAAAR